MPQAIRRSTRSRSPEYTDALQGKSRRGIIDRSGQLHFFYILPHNYNTTKSQENNKEKFPQK